MSLSTKEKLLLLGACASSLALSIAVTSCAPKHQSKAADGYYFEKETFRRTDIPLTIVLVGSNNEMEQILKQKMKTSDVAGKFEAKDVAAFSIINNNDSKCTIYMIDPKVSYQPEYIGHELVHCVYGVWHSEPQS